jgi:ribosomal protein L24E
MTGAPRGRLPLLILLAVLVTCAPETRDLPSAPAAGITAHRSPAHGSSWSAPVNLGAPLNSAGDEFSASLSPNGRSIYFSSDRTDLPGAQGGNDIWVSRRGCAHCPWGTPVNLGPTFNSTVGEGNVSFSNDGRVMFFNSAKPGGFGRSDIYVSRRTDPNDDFDWEPPANLGPDVNTSDNEGGAAFLQHSGEGRRAALYFNRGVIQQQKADIYVAPVTRDGATLGPAVLVSEISDPAVNDGGLTVRQDGKELIFWSNRGSPAGTVVGDLFVSTRRSLHDSWSTPLNLGPPVNTEVDETSARLSTDGRTLFIISARPGGLGGTQFGFDIWTSTRTPSREIDGDDEDDDDDAGP